MVYDIVMIFRIGKTEYTTISHSDENLIDCVARTGLDPAKLNLIFKGKRIMDQNMRLNAIVGDARQASFMGMCKQGYNPVSCENSKREVDCPPDSVEHDPESQSSAASKTLYLGDASPGDRIFVIKHNRIRNEVHVHAASYSVGDIIKLIETETAVDGIELISAGRVFRGNDATPLSELKSSEFLLRHTASFWQQDEHDRALKALSRELDNLLGESRKLLKVFQLDETRNRIRLAGIEHRLAEMRDSLASQSNPEAQASIDSAILKIKKVLGKG